MEPRELAQQLEQRLRKDVSVTVPYAGKLWDAMGYSLLTGGKRVRPVLMLMTAISLGVEPDCVFPYAEGLEMIHTYSLIHDDLPAMDNDDYRRGRLTNHKVFGEAEAILAGDGLLTLAFEIMGRAIEKDVSAMNLDKAAAERIVRGALCQSYIARCAGTEGMVAGQMADLESEGRKIDKDELDYIERNKTSKLLMAALVGGAILAGHPMPEPGNVTYALERAAEKIGIAFQITDDVMDVESTFEEMGKQAGSDEKDGKSTYVSLYGVKKAKEQAELLTEQAAALLEVLPGDEGADVRRFIRSLVNRRA